MVQGVSTCKVKAIVEQLCGSGVSSCKVSWAAAVMDETLQSRRSRPLGEIVFLLLDARYKKIRLVGQIQDAAILIVAGVDRLEKRHRLGLSVSLGEQEIH
jgi:putative transposase